MSRKKSYNARKHVEIMFVEIESGKLKDLEKAINDKINYLQGGIKNAVGAIFDVEIIDIKYISPTCAMIITDTKMA